MIREHCCAWETPGETPVSFAIGGERITSDSEARGKPDLVTSGKLIMQSCCGHQKWHSKTPTKYTCLLSIPDPSIIQKLISDLLNERVDT